MTLCILAAGTGSRSFSADIHKALLPVKNKAIISHLIEKFPPDTKIVVALGHHQNQIKNFLRLSHPEIHFSFVQVDPYQGPGSGPGTSLNACKGLLEGEFYFAACDSFLLSEIPLSLSSNWIGVSPVQDVGSFCTLDSKNGIVTQFFDKDPQSPSKMAFNGIAFVRDHKEFWNHLLSANSNSETQVIPGLKALIPSGLQIVDFAWRDTGSRNSYIDLCRELGGNYSFEGKTTELTYRYGKTIIKFFASENGARNRFEKVQNYQKTFPDQLGYSGQFLHYAFTEGQPLAEKLSSESCLDFLNWMKTHFWQTQKIEPGLWHQQLQSFYFDKTRDRLKSLEKNKYFKKEFSEQSQLINGISCEPPLKLLEMAKDYIFEHALASSFHGDLHDENIIVTPDHCFVLIDWRDQFGQLSHVGDLYYDLAKFLHTFDFSVDAMKNQKYSFQLDGSKINIENEIAQPQQQARLAFYRFVENSGYDQKMVDLINGVVFLNMSPLYDDQLGIYLYFLGQLTLKKGLLK